MKGIKCLHSSFFCIGNYKGFLTTITKIKKLENIKSVCVYCASSTKIDEAYFEAAKQLGELLAEKNIRIINGAGCQGLMAAVSDSALEAGGKVTGVIPHFMVEQGWNHTGLTQTIETETMHERKNLMAEMSDAVITLPGGCGTLEELLEIITWKQLGLYLKPIVILNINGYFNSLIEMLEKAIEQNFMRPEHEKLWEMANTPEEAVELLFKIPMWNKEFRKFAAI